MQSLRVSIKEWTFSGFTFPCLPRSSQGGRSLDPRRPRTRLGGGRRAPPAGAAPAPPASRLTSRRRRGLQPPPASRSGTRLPSSRTALERLLSLPGTPRLPTASRPPHPQAPTPQLRGASGMQLRFSAHSGSSPRTQNSPLAGAPLCLARRRKGNRGGGWRGGAPRPPPASRPPLRPPGKARLPARVGHAVRCRLPSALTFAAEAVAEAAAAMFPC